MASSWSFEQLYESSRSYQVAAILNAAAELDVFGVLSDEPAGAAMLADMLDVDERGLGMLLDALAALNVVHKHEAGYRLASEVRPLVDPQRRGNLLAMLRHQANCQRRWAQLAVAVRSGGPLPRVPSLRGVEADEESFIEAMDNITSPIATDLVAEVSPSDFDHVLDVGGASGTWTIAFLLANPGATATLFDLPHVIPMARRRLTQAGLLHRVRLVPGDFLRDPLPDGADLAWISAIVHQNSRSQNRRLFAALAAALRPEAILLIRDVIMDPARTTPIHGALFAIHMLLATEGGGTYTFEELRQDLEVEGFHDVRLRRHDDGMNAVLQARRLGPAATSKSAGTV